MRERLRDSSLPKEKILGSLGMDLQVAESAGTWHRMPWANQAEQFLRKNDELGLVSAKRSLSYYLFIIINGCCCRHIPRH
jgi:hypothetical protein